jgi:hypothetical protein
MLKMPWLSASIVAFFETARALMIVASFQPHFWPEAISTTTYLVNIQPSAALQSGIHL